MKLIMDDGEELAATAVDLKPTDRIILKSQKRLSDEEKAELTRKLAQVFPHNAGLLIDAGFDLSILRKGETAVDVPA